MDCPECVAEERGEGRCAIHTPTFYALATENSNATGEQGTCSQCSTYANYLFLISTRPRMLACRTCLSILSESIYFNDMDDHDDHAAEHDQKERDHDHLD